MDAVIYKFNYLFKFFFPKSLVEILSKRHSKNVECGGEGQLSVIKEELVVCKIMSGR